MQIAGPHGTCPGMSTGFPLALVHLLTCKIYVLASEMVRDLPLVDIWHHGMKLDTKDLTVEGGKVVLVKPPRGLSEQCHPPTQRRGRADSFRDHWQNNGCTKS